MLSKSKYCAFTQCPKRLWLQTYHPELSEDNAALDARMTTGNEVVCASHLITGSLSCSLIDVSYG